MAVVGAGVAAVVVLAAVAAHIHRCAAAKPLFDGPRDNVHHPAHGRAAVLRRAGSLDHLDPCHIRHQVLAQVHGGACAGRDRQTIDQHQNLVAGEALQRQLKTGLAVHLAQLQARHILQRLFQRAGMGARDLFARNHFDPYGHIVQRTLRPRACHHHGRKRGSLLGIRLGERQSQWKKTQGKTQKRRRHHRGNRSRPWLWGRMITVQMRMICYSIRILGIYQRRGWGSVLLLRHSVCAVVTVNSATQCRE